MSNPTDLDSLIDTCLHPERNGLLIKEQVAEGASHEWVVKRELKAAIKAIIARECDKARIDELERCKPYMEADNEKGVRLYIMVDVPEGQDSQNYRIAQLKAEAAQKGEV